MSPKYGLDQEQWRVLVDRLNTGIVVFDSSRQITYANEEASRLMNYPPADLIGLTINDWFSLFKPGRLDEPSFLRTFQSQLLSSQTFRLTTGDRHLYLTPLDTAHPLDGYTIFTITESQFWRSDLISDFVTEELHSPLAFASSYCETLMSRLDEDWSQAFELQDLTRIIRDSVNQALGMWLTLSRLKHTNPDQPGRMKWDFRPLSFSAAVRAARREVDDRGVTGITALEFKYPSKLPMIRASEAQLHAALSALIENLAGRMVKSKSTMLIKTQNKESYIQVDLIPSSKESSLRGYFFDEVPLVITEQIILQHGGRLWLETHEDARQICSFTLPIWNDK